MGNIPRRDPLSRDRGGRPLPQRGVRPEKLQEGSTDADKAKGIPFDADLPEAVDGDRLEIRGGEIVARPPEHGGGDAAPPHITGTPHEHDLLSTTHTDTYAEDTEEHLDVMTWIGGELPTLGIAIVHNAGGATTWDISYTPENDGVWQTAALPASITHARPRPICLTPDLWFVANVGGFPSTYATGGTSECNREMARSTDGGATWGATTVGDETCTTDRSETGDELNGLTRIDRSPDGRIWAARQVGSSASDPIRCEVYYSDDDGADMTWTLSGTLTLPGENQVCIAILSHPTDPNTVVLISSITSDDDRVVTFVTEDRGANWTTNAPTVASGDNFALTENGNSSSFLMLPTGRLIISHRRTAAVHAAIYTSDDYGLTWDLRHTDIAVDEDNTYMIRQGGWIGDGATIVGIRSPDDFAADFAVIKSTDYGTTWTVRDIAPPTGTAGDNDLLYLPGSDSIVFLMGNVTTQAGRIWSLADASGGGTTWEDITGDLLLGTATDQHWESLAAIPSSTVGGRWEARPADDHGVHGGAGTGTMTTVKEGGVQVGGADIVTLDFGTGFDITETPDTEVNIAIDLSELDHGSLGGLADDDHPYILESLLDALGDLIYASADDTPAKLSGNTVAVQKFLGQTGNGSVSAAPAWDTGNHTFGATLAPAALSADQTDYSPTNYDANTGVLRLTASTTTRTIFSLAGGTANRLLYLYNGGVIPIVLAHEYTTGTTAAMRFSIAGAIDYTIPGRAGVLLWYDGASSRWRVTGANIAYTPTAHHLAGVLTPPQITADQDNYSPTTIASSTVLRLDTDATWSITGIAANASGNGANEGRILIIHNIGANDIVLTHDDGATSTAANRFVFAGDADVTLTPDTVVMLQYDATTARWRMIGGTGGGGGGSGSMTTVKEAGSQVGDADIVTLDFGAGFDLTESPDTEINVALDLSEVMTFPDGEHSIAANALSGVAAGAAQVGHIEIATQAEVDAGTDTTRAVVPDTLSEAVQDGQYLYAADAGASDAYAITLTPAPAAYVAGQVFHFKANTANSGAATLNVNSLGAKDIVVPEVALVGRALATGEIKEGQIVSVLYDGTRFWMLSPVGSKKRQVVITLATPTSGDSGTFVNLGFLNSWEHETITFGLAVAVAYTDITLAHTFDIYKNLSASSSGTITIAGGGATRRGTATVSFTMTAGDRIEIDRTDTNYTDVTGGIHQIILVEA